MCIGATLTLITAWVVDWRKERKIKIANRIKELQLLISIALEIKNGINRCKHYIELSEEEPPKISYSKLYTYYEVWIRDLIKVTYDPVTLGILHDVYEKFFFINLNIDAKNYEAVIAFANQYLLKIIGNYNKIVREISNKKSKWNIEINVPTELIEIETVELSPDIK